MISRIVERQPIVFGQPPEWYTRFEKIREQRRLDKLMPPVDKVADEILNAREEKFESEDKDQLVGCLLAVGRVGDEKAARGIDIGHHACGQGERPSFAAAQHARVPLPAGQQCFWLVISQCGV